MSIERLGRPHKVLPPLDFELYSSPVKALVPFNAMQKFTVDLTLRANKLARIKIASINDRTLI